jgi:cysteinyl-tRNA synthetase
MSRKNILDLIGNTPLVPIRRLNPFKKVLILAKMESFNPGGSIKDRIALSMIEGAEERGELTRDRIILEASSGNTGIGLAMVSAVKGYRCLIAMSEGASIERREIMRAYGAEILLTPAHLGTDGAIEAVYELAREASERYFPTDQFNNPDNWKAHYNTTANEIWEQTECGCHHLHHGNHRNPHGYNQEDKGIRPRGQDRRGGAIPRPQAPGP